ncbi:CRISPR-associated endoribonuclease Cas6 [Candidatus Bathyarchaeota archaeon]|nr:CRISPR-associated endoribonuclease Cas6 [Candidatus Bathyarchaeota archaeon]
MPAVVSDVVKSLIYMNDGGANEMRLLVSLQALGDWAYDLKYHHKLQGFLYRLMEGTIYRDLHDRKGYKFFCFSNLFPPRDARNEEKRNLLIASPNPNLIQVLHDRIAKVDVVHIGDGAFRVVEVKELDPRIREGSVLVAGTPIIIRIPKERYNDYGIVSEKYSYVYWRKQHSFAAFVKQIEDNLRKKYVEYQKEEPAPEPIFDQFMFKKQVCNHVVFEGKEAKVFGSLWEFPIGMLSEGRRKMLQFGLDCGFGELNSLGFGFMNISYEKKDLIE